MWYVKGSSRVEGIVTLIDESLSPPAYTVKVSMSCHALSAASKSLSKGFSDHFPLTEGLTLCPGNHSVLVGSASASKRIGPPACGLCLQPLSDEPPDSVLPRGLSMSWAKMMSILCCCHSFKAGSGKQRQSSL